MIEETDYIKYRGKCKEFCEELVAKDPSLRMVRGHYEDTFWGKQPHWWCVDIVGNIVDPTVKQFADGGMGEYIEFDGWCECSQCGKRIHESEARFESRYAFCSYTCNMRFVGL